MTRIRGQEERRFTHLSFLDSMPEMMERPVGDASVSSRMQRSEPYSPRRWTNALKTSFPTVGK